MAIGPVQLLVFGFTGPDFRGEILEELERLRELDTIRVIDSLAVYKDADGDVAVLKMSNLTTEENMEIGATVGALVGIGALGDVPEVAEVAEAGAKIAAEEGIEVFSADSAWDVVGDIPPDTAAAMLLIEHHWAVPLRDAIVRAGGFRVSDGFISPVDLVAIGLMSAEDAGSPSLIETR